MQNDSLDFAAPPTPRADVVLGRVVEGRGVVAEVREGGVRADAEANKDKA